MKKPSDNARVDSPIAEDLDTTEKYVVEVFGLGEKTGPFKDEKTNELQTSIIWRFHVWHRDGTPVLAEDGNPFELLRFTPDGTWSNPASGKKALTRQFIEALVGRAVSDDEISAAIDRGIEKVLMGKRAVADLEEVQTVDRDGNEITRYKISRLQPFKPRIPPGSISGPQQQQQRQPVAAAAAPPRRAPAPDPDDPTDLPF